jgi:peptide chain release factor 1
MLDRLAAIESRYRELEEQMSRPDIAGDYVRLQETARERASLEILVSLYRRYREVLQNIAGAKSILLENNDEELRILAREEQQLLMAEQDRLEQAIRVKLLPEDPNDQRDVIIEVRAGTGGNEAALFAASLLRAYIRYAQRHRWEVSILDSTDTGIGGLKETSLEVRGKGAYSRLKYESGVHRVQRVPVTESSGRVHTSTATVAVLPEVEEVELKVNPDDLRIETMRAGGHGGQNVQKLETAVRITHLPTGVVVSCSDERRQAQNRAKAMTHLRARLYEMERRRREQELTAQRRAQVGTGDRAEKVRTYNFPQNRVTDHRVSLTVHNLTEVLDGELDELLEALIADEQARKLDEALSRK